MIKDLNSMENLYKIDIYDKRTGKNTEESGFYFGNLKDILTRLDFNINEIDRELKVSKIELKHIDFSRPTHKVDFTCFDETIEELKLATKLDFGHYRF
jgi:hypothetical protein